MQHNYNFANPIEEVRARLTDAHDGEAIDAAVNAATRKVRPATARKLKASRAGRRP
ncbi:MAG TPA: hypothetical protein VHO06_06890 [Polyangia bacterium]|nr:hypothetical protein [Polyangia bacterium]